MLQEAIDLQQKAVLDLVALTDIKDTITFKAPTGSGKTYMMADMMNRILEKDSDVVFLVSTLSKAGLATQNYEKFLEYSSKGNFKALKPHLISSIIAGEERLHVPIGYNVYLLPRDLYKKGGRLMQGAMANFLRNITSAKRYNGQEKKVYLIKDECHIATNNLDSLTEAFFTKIYNFSATPKLTRGQDPDVQITNYDAENAKLIKRVEWTDDERTTVADALEKFQKVKKEYRNMLGVNPCLIIQISNKGKADEELQHIYAEFNKAKNADLKWMTIVNSDKECRTNDVFEDKKLPVQKWKDYARANTSTIDVIIFKMVITEGWDIPRACMLYQVRDSQSKQLDEQVMGRVRRNPRLLDFEMLPMQAQDLAAKAWVWGVAPDGTKKGYGVKLQVSNTVIANEIRIKTTRLKTLQEKKAFDITQFLCKQLTTSSPRSIFDLYSAYKKSDYAVQCMCNDYTENFTKWLEFTENIEDISKASNEYMCNYEDSMEVVTDEEGQDIEVAFAPISYYTDNGYYVNIADWVWKRNDEKEEFSFDSEAEKKWTEILKDIVKEDNINGDRVGRRIDVAGANNKRIYLWGKNYVANSPIKFEYYMGAKHSSYPDFVMKDSNNNIHIFEVKSVNISSNMVGGVDNNIYKTKLNELKKAYRQASKLTNQFFYLPIQNGDNWTIFRYTAGEESQLTKEQFINSCLA